MITILQHFTKSGYINSAIFILPLIYLFDAQMTSSSFSDLKMFQSDDRKSMLGQNSLIYALKALS